MKTQFEVDKKPKPKAYRYARFSSGQQAEGMSLDRQQDAAEAWAESRGMTIDDAFIDAGVSASRGRNLVLGSSFKKFWNAVRAKDINPGSYLLVESVSRFSRLGSDDMRPILRELVEAGITVLFFDFGTEVTIKNWGSMPVVIILTILAEMAKERAEELARYGRAGWKKRKDQARATGKPASRILPFWLTSKKIILANGDLARGPIEKHPTYVPIIERIYSEYLNGRGKALIAKGLNADRVPIPPRNVGSAKRAERWHAETVGRILANRAVMGELTWHAEIKTAITLKSGIEASLGRKRQLDGEPMPAYYPQIISPELFAAAATKRDSNRARAGARIGSGRNEVTHICARLAVCTCGASMTRIAKSNGTVPRYLCSTAPSGKAGSCERTYVIVSDVEKALVAAADSLTDLAPAPDPGLNTERMRVEAELTAERGKLTALTDSIMEMFERSEPISSVVNQAHTKAEARVTELAAALNTLQLRAAASSTNVVKQALGNMVGALKGYGSGPLDYDAPLVNNAMIEVFEKIVIVHATRELILHYKIGPPPVTITY